MKKPDWYLKKTQKKSSRKRSDEQESRIAKDVGGKKSINSGATFGQNDVFSDSLEIEAKTTSKESFSITSKTWGKLENRTPIGKTPVMIVTLESTDQTFAVVRYDDFLENFDSE